MNHQPIRLLLASITFSLILFASEVLRSQVDDVSKSSTSTAIAKPSAEKDRFQKIAAISRKYFSLNLKEEELLMKRPDNQDIFSFFLELQVKQMASSTRGPGNRNIEIKATKSGWGISFKSGDYVATEVAGDVSDLGFVLRLKEESFPYRKLEIRAKNEYEYSIESTGGIEDGFFRIEQDKDGQILIQDFTTEHPVILRTHSFESLWLEFPEYVDGPLFDRLKQIGITVPPGIHSDEVRLQLLAQLKSVTSKWDEFEDVVERLDSEKYETRIKAKNELEKNFEYWVEEIQFGSFSDVVSPEAKAALKKVLNKKGTENQRQLTSIIEQLNLINEPKVLIALWSVHSDDELLVARIVGKLKQIVAEEKHRDFGTDFELWKNHFVDSKGTQKSLDFSCPKLSDIDTRLDDAAEQISYLVSLKIENGIIRIDRDRWVKHFKDSEVKSSQYEHVLFNQIRKQLETNARKKAIYYKPPAKQPKNSRHRLVALTDLDMELRKNDDSLSDMRRARNSKIKDDCFLFSIRTHAPPITRMYLIEHPDQGFRLLIAIDKSATVLDLRQDADGYCRGYLADGANSIVLEPGQGKKFFESNRTAFKEHFVPLLRRFGVDVSYATGSSTED